MASKQEEGRTTHVSYVFEKKYKDGELGGRFIYKYNDRGNRVEYKKYDLDNNLVSGEKTDYEYDQNDNWIKQIPLNRRGPPLYLLEREIEYFDK